MILQRITDIQIHGCVISDNHGGRQGGAIFFQTWTDRPPGRTNITATTFVSNRADNGGGISMVNMAILGLEDCRFDSNIASTQGGGAIAAEGQKTIDGVHAITLRSTTFADNVAQNGPGGAMRFVGGDAGWGPGPGGHGNPVRIHDCTFLSNRASFKHSGMEVGGSAISATESRFVLTQSTLKGSIQPWLFIGTRFGNRNSLMEAGIETTIFLPTTDAPEPLCILLGPQTWLHTKGSTFNCKIANGAWPFVKFRAPNKNAGVLLPHAFLIDEGSVFKSRLPSWAKTKSELCSLNALCPGTGKHGTDALQGHSFADISWLGCADGFHRAYMLQGITWAFCKVGRGSESNAFLEICKNVGKDVVLEGQVLKSGMEYSILRESPARLSINVGKHISSEEGSNYTIQLKEGSTETKAHRNRKQPHALYNISAGQYEIQMVDEQNRLICPLVQSFAVNCGSGYTPSSSGRCERSVCDEPRRMINGECAMPSAKVSMLTHSVSRKLLKPSCGWKQHGQQDLSLQIQIQPMDDITFDWYIANTTTIDRSIHLHRMNGSASHVHAGVIRLELESASLSGREEGGKFTTLLRFNGITNGITIEMPDVIQIQVSVQAMLSLSKSSFYFKIGGNVHASDGMPVTVVEGAVVEFQLYARDDDGFNVTDTSIELFELGLLGPNGTSLRDIEMRYSRKRGHFFHQKLIEKEICGVYRIWIRRVHIAAQDISSTVESDELDSIACRIPVRLTGSGACAPLVFEIARPAGAANKTEGTFRLIGAGIIGVLLVLLISGLGRYAHQNWARFRSIFGSLLRNEVTYAACMLHECMV